MEKLTDLSQTLTQLGHPARLAVFRLLMSRFPDRLPAGEIATVLGLPASTLSTHLAALRRVGLLSQRRRGTTLSYAIDLAAVREMFGTLLVDCCRGRVDLCLPTDLLTTPTLLERPLMEDRKYNVLFVCSGNSARSIFAESILREIAGDRFVAYSAGLDPKSELNACAVSLLHDKGIDTTPLRAKDVAEFRGEDAPKLDFVFTVCDRSANEVCAPWGGIPITSQWSTPDPVKMTGTDGAKALAFQQAYGALRNRIVAFTSLPFDQLDRMALQSAVDEIGLQQDAADA
ncbi:metalloregulator ArsR/SmtB family transcription factor [Jannaschia sp. 2305UL9-9]|uniref:metalloregulator ArsR/SmtB family transcription factor n=1 Tax=Jannaschia sp. 2305UL9-9 TaxID=3121638 RepID=UPI003529213B